MINKRGTATKSFGSTARINHDSSKFYNSALYKEIRLEKHKKTKYIENEIDTKYLNQILCKSSESMDELPNNSVHLMVTSPPYNVGKEYDENLTLSKYLCFLEKVFNEVYRVLVPGGRACINVANLGRKPYIPLHSYIIQIMEQIGFIMRGEIIWDKQVGGGTAWGSWLSPSNPVLRDQHEYILIFSKETLKRENSQNKKATINREEFLEFTRSIWKFPPESAKKVGHPAPFPVELPYRCIQLYTFENDIILDPFIGVGTTAIAALKTRRKFIGYEINSNYIELANNRIETYQSQIRFL